MGKTATALALPRLTTDLDEAKAHLDEYGVARIADALDPDECDRVRTRLVEQAERERAAGVAFFEGPGGSNQRVWNLPSKGAVFNDLLRAPLVRTLVRHVLDGDYIVSSHAANIAGPGGEPMALHYDQGYVPRSVDIALTVTVMWMLDDFTEDNGATRLVPGSHRVQEPLYKREVATVAGLGPAGTAMVYDGRIWHGTGANTTTDKYRHGIPSYFCRPWLRAQENYALSTHPDVLATADDELKTLLGFRVWRTLGGVQGPWGLGTPGTADFRTGSYVDRLTDYLGEL